MPPAATPPQNALGEVAAAAHAYEAALVAGDVAAATAWFETASDVSRFGADGAQLGPAAVAAARAAQGPQPEPEWLLDEVRELGPGLALHLAVLARGDVQVQRTQVWRRGVDGWQIAHAHVARLAGPVAVTR